MRLMGGRDSILLRVIKLASIGVGPQRVCRSGVSGRLLEFGWGSFIAISAENYRRRTTLYKYWFAWHDNDLTKSIKRAIEILHVLSEALGGLPVIHVVLCSIEILN